MATAMADGSSHFTPRSLSASIERHDNNRQEKTDLPPSLAVTGEVDDRGALTSASNHLNKIIREIPLSDCSREVLEFILHSDKEYTELFGVPPQDYQDIACILEDFAEEIGRKARVTYTLQSTIIVEMPSSVHETPFMAITPPLQRFLDQVTSDWPEVSATIPPAHNIGGRKGFAVPDITVSIGIPGIGRIIPVIGETTFSQSHPSVIRKLDTVIDSSPGLIMVLLVEINEHPYHSPEPSQDTHNGPLDFDAFMTASESQMASVGDAVKYHGHTWCHLSSVKLTIWIQRGGLRPIDVHINDTNSDQVVARGELYPAPNMGEINEAMEMGMDRVKDRVVAFCQGKFPGEIFSDKTTMIDWNEVWRKMARDLRIAATYTAYNRYLQWYGKSANVAQPVSGM